MPIKVDNHLASRSFCRVMTQTDYVTKRFRSRHSGRCMTAPVRRRPSPRALRHIPPAALASQMPTHIMASAVFSILPSADKTPEFDALLSQRGAPTTAGRVGLDTEALESFLKEAYRIVGLQPTSACKRL